MFKLLQDALEVATLRVKPLSNYAYQYWQPVLWLTLLGALPAFFDDLLTTDVPQRLLFWIVLTWVQALVMTAFFSWWLKQGDRWKGGESLFPLIVLVTSTEIVEPLIDLLPEDLKMIVAIFLLIAQMVILVRALAVATGSGIQHVVSGLIIYLPTAVLIFLVALNIAASVDWIATPLATGEPL